MLINSVIITFDEPVLFFGILNSPKLFLRITSINVPTNLMAMPLKR